MGAVIGDALPPAIGVAVAPVPTLLFSTRAASAGTGLLCGWGKGVGGL
ncbi:hypothetical protein [Pseudonocardia pini]|nr:hypothetical protein [Pseudonocardia pini]